MHAMLLSNKVLISLSLEGLLGAGVTYGVKRIRNSMSTSSIFKWKKKEKSLSRKKVNLSVNDTIIMIQISEKAKRTHNPIRAIVDNLKRPENHEKKGKLII